MNRKAFMFGRHVLFSPKFFDWGCDYFVSPYNQITGFLCGISHQEQIITGTGGLQ